MSVVATNAFSTATGNGATTSFPYTFPARNAADVAVYVNGTLQVAGITVTPNVGANGGTVLFTTAPANLAAILIGLSPSFQQSTTFINAGAYNPSAVDGANDQAAIRDIYLKGLLDRAALVPLGETMGPLPAAASRIGKFFGFDAAGNPIALSGTGNDSALRTDLAASGGAALLGWIASGLGAVARTILDKLRESVSAEDFGALGNGIADDGAAILRPFDAGYKNSRLAGFKNYLLKTIGTLPSYGTLSSTERAVVTKGASIDLFDMSAQASRLQGLNIQGAGSASKTGRGAVINGGANSYDQRIIDSDLVDFDGYCVEFTASDAGQRFQARGSNFCRTNPALPAIIGPSVEDSTAGNRTFTDCGTIVGGCLFDLRGMANTGIVNCQMVNLLFRATTSRTRMTGCRVANGGGTLVIDGYDNNIIGNVIAGNIQLAATSQRCVVGPNNLIAGGTITDLSTATGSNMNYIYAAQGFSFTPVLGQTSGTGPTLGNGTATGRKYQNGRLVTVMVDVQFGSTSTFGDAVGDITVAMPSPDNRTAAFPAEGMAIATIGGVNTVGAVQIAQGDNKFTIVNNGGTTGWKQGQPNTFTATSRIRFTITYEQG